MTGTKKGFVIWDTRIEGVEDVLRCVRDPTPVGFAKVTIFGLDAEAGATWTKNVEPAVVGADRIVALLDLPNANVGYEIGYALALGKPVRLALCGTDGAPPWCDRAPLRAELVTRADSPDAIRELLAHEKATQLDGTVSTGDDTLLLAPPVGAGAAAIERVKRLKPNWRTLDRDGWALEDLREKLAGVGRVVWVLAPFPHRSDERDGEENASASVIAGFAAGHGLQVHIFRHAKARLPLDVGHRVRDYANVEVLEEFVEALDRPPEERGTSADVLDTYRRFLRHRHRNLVSFFEGDGLGDVYVELTLESAGETPERIKQNTLPELLAELGPNARLTVLGDPGAGKSTVCRRLCFDLAGTLKESPDGAVPIFVPLFRLAAEAGRDVFALTERDVRNDGSTGLATELRRLAKETDRVWLLLDGLDEVPEGAVDDVRGHIEALARDYPRLRITVTARKIGYAAVSGFRRATIQPLDSRGQRDLLTRWLGEEHGERVHREVTASPAMADPARNPLLLSLIAFLAREHDGVPPTRVELYDQAIEVLLKRGHGAKATKGVRSPTAAKPLLAALSLRLQETEGESWTKAELLESLEETLAGESKLASKLSLAWTDGPESFLDDVAEKSGLLADHGDQNGKWRYLHRSLREALAAEALAATGPDAIVERATRLGCKGEGEHGNDVARRLAHWGETFALLCGRSRSTTAALVLLTRLRDASHALALRALPNVDGFDMKTILAFLDDLDGWDGDHLFQIVRQQLLRGEPKEVVRKEMRRITEGEVSLDKVAWSLYALEFSGVLDPTDAQEREAFLEEFGLGRDQKERPKVQCAALPPEGGEATFWMGSADGGGQDRERPRHRVTLSPFEIGITTVTRAEYARFDSDHVCSGGADHPATQVSWWRAWLFCRWLGGALPTEAQWEYACRAGADGDRDLWCFGYDKKQLSEYAWYGEGSEGKAHPVAEKNPNLFGLYDMHGNVKEWCLDWFGAYPTDGPADLADPTGPVSGALRVRRGGGAWNVAGGARSACRSRLRPGNRWVRTGFRVAFLAAAPDLESR